MCEHDKSKYLNERNNAKVFCQRTQKLNYVVKSWAINSTKQRDTGTEHKKKPATTKVAPIQFNGLHATV